MEIAFKKKNKTIMIRVVGEIDHHTAKELRIKTENALSQMGGTNILFDFSDVTFMDSSGIGLIMGRYKTVRTLGGRIVIYGMNRETERILKMAGVDRIAEIY